MGETPETAETAEVTGTTTNTPAAETAAKEPVEVDDDHPLKKTIKAIRAERDKANRDLAEVRKQVEQFEAAGKSDLEKAQGTAEKATERAATAERELARYKAIAATGLPAELHEFLGNGTEEELTEKAKKLMAAMGTKPGTPKPDPSQGARGKGPDLDAQIADAKAKGDIRRAMQLENQKLRELIVGAK